MSQQNQQEQINQTQQQPVQMQQNQVIGFCDTFGNYYLKPEYLELFNGTLQTIGLLRQYQDKKWTPEETNAYFTCLYDMEQYIYSWIFTGKNYYYPWFIQVLQDYKVTNPVGWDLYEKQLDFLQFKQTGYKKKKRGNEGEKPVKPNPQFKPKQQQQKIVIRKDDPVQNIEQILNRPWPKDPKYASKQIIQKQNANLIFIGHVDSGKSTLTGNILKELKQVDEQQLIRNKQQAKQTNMEAWQLAFVADIDPNQRKRGKTVQCSKLMFTLQKRRFTLFDAPGHKNYVPNMIMGACQSDIAVLIVSAKEGQFQSGFEKDGQTKQHAMLAKALGVQGFLVAVTKMNTVQWSQKRFMLIKQAVMPFLQNSCGFSNVPFVPIDSLTNRNIHTNSGDTWYKGPSLIDLLNNIEIPHRNPKGPLRIPIIDKFKDLGSLYVYGKIQSGVIEQDQTVSLLPSREYVILKQIYNARDQKMPYAFAGQNVKIRIKGIEQQQLNRGDVLCNNLNYCQQSAQFKANLTVLEVPQKKKLISSGYQCVLHMHAISENIEIASVDARFDAKSKKLIEASFLKNGEKGRVLIKLQKPICMEKFDFMPGLGRFTLRDQGKTIGFGQIIKIKPAKKLLDEQKQHLGLPANGSQKIPVQEA